MRFLLISLLISNFVFAQKGNQQIAHQYYLNGDYQKAAVLYEKLIKDNYSTTYYDRYYTSLIEIENYNKG